MTMADNLCEVCRVNPPIGVASTLIPYSCAYCAQCARLHAQPEIVFVCWFDTFGIEYSKMRDGLVDQVVTFKDGKYVTYREWAEEYAKTYVPIDPPTA